MSDIYLSADDIEGIGGRLIIEEEQVRSVNFEDAGWMKVRNDDVRFIDESLNADDYDTYIHETGVIVQTSQSMPVYFI